MLGVKCWVSPVAVSVHCESIWCSQMTVLLTLISFSQQEDLFCSHSLWEVKLLLWQKWFQFAKRLAFPPSRDLCFSLAWPRMKQVAYVQLSVLIWLSIWGLGGYKKNYKDFCSSIQCTYQNIQFKSQFITEKWTFSNWKTNWGPLLYPFEVPFLILTGCSWTKSSWNPQKWLLYLVETQQN